MKPEGNKKRKKNGGTKRKHKDEGGRGNARRWRRRRTWQRRRDTAPKENLEEPACAPKCSFHPLSCIHFVFFFSRFFFALFSFPGDAADAVQNSRVSPTFSHYYSLYISVDLVLKIRHLRLKNDICGSNETYFLFKSAVLKPEVML